MAINDDGSWTTPKLFKKYISLIDVSRRAEKYKLDVFNASNNDIRPVTMGEIVHMGKKLCWDTPLNDVVWYPNGSVTNCWYYNYFCVLFYQLLPALFIDGLLLLLKKKPMWVPAISLTRNGVIFKTSSLGWSRYTGRSS